MRGVRNAQGSKRARRRSAFTIMEMVIVVAIVIVLVTLVVPNVSMLWTERKLADAENTVSGLLTSTRAKALQTGHDRGLFFFVDDHNVQRVVTIEQDAAKSANPATGYIWQDIFLVTTERSFTLPAPMRVVPRMVVVSEGDPGEVDLTTFNDLEIGNNDLLRLATRDEIHRHRNAFSVCFSGDGRLLVGRNMVLLDADKDDDRRGDITDLPVGNDQVKTFHALQGSGTATTAIKAPLDPLKPGKSPAIEHLVVDGSNVALNFPSVDGLLVYDDSLFAEMGTNEEKRKFLLDRGQPFYIHRVTGAVVRGPVAENVAAAP